MTTKRSRLAGWCYRMLLLTYPAAFRREFGREAAEAFAELHADRRGLGPRLSLWWRSVCRVVADGLRERATERRARRRERATGLERFARDVRLGTRLWRRTPLHAILAIGSLALGVGVNVAVANLMLALYLNTPAVARPDELATLAIVREGQTSSSFSAAEAIALSERSAAFRSVAADRFGWAWITGAGAPVEVEGAVVSYDYFDVLGLEPALGRFFGAGDRGAVAPHSVAVVSHAFWTNQLGGDRLVIGRTLGVNGRRVGIVAVAPAGFEGLHAEQQRGLWLPHDLADSSGAGETYALFRANGAFELIGRLAPETSREAAAVEATSLLAGLASGAGAAPAPQTVLVRPIRGVHPDARAGLIAAPGLAVGIAGILLLLTCLNLSGLLLARNLARRRELALRLALGETRRGLVRQLFSESVVLAAAAAGAGLLTAAWGQELVARWYAYSLPGLDLSLRGTSVALAVLLAGGSAVLFGGVPAHLAAGGDVGAGLRAGDGSRAASASASRTQTTLVIAQVALSLMLVTGAITMMRSMSMAFRSAGADPESVLHYRLRPSRAGYDGERAERYLRDALAGVRALGTVRGVALARVGTDRGWCCPVEVARPGRPEAGIARLDNNHVTPAFFDVLGIPVEAGRGFDDSDTRAAPRVVVVNRVVADRFWPGTSPLGGRLRIDDVEHEVIGVTPAVHASRPGEEPVGYLYLSFWQLGDADARLFVRHEGDAGDVSRRVLGVLADAGADAHVGQVGTLADRVALAHAPQRALLGLLRACAIVAVLLCAIGLYGLLSVAVGRRTRELAIRRALGASSRRLLRGVAGDGLRVVAAGTALGLVGAWMQGRLLEGFLYGTRPTEPLLLAGAAGLVMFIGLLTTALPARRAAAADPASLLRGDA